MNKRTMKKKIPYDKFYCYDFRNGRYICPWLIDLSNTKDANKLREKYCTEKKYCDEYKQYGTCEHCNSIYDYPEQVTMCRFMKEIEVGQYPLGDQCKICGVHKENKYGW